MSKIKETWVVHLPEDGSLSRDAYSTEAAAIDAAKKHLQNEGCEGDELWVYRLSRVIVHDGFPPVRVNVLKVGK